MADVDFSDFESAERWFEAQSIETRCVITSRAALRVVANVGLIGDAHKESLALTSLRAMLTSAGRGLGRPADVEDLQSAARSAADSAGSAFSVAGSADSAGSAADSAARSAFSAFSAARSAAGSAADSAARSAARSAAGSAADSAARSAIEFDATQKNDQLVQKTVWAGTDVPEGIVKNHAAFLTYLDSHEDWRFWRRWYLEMWEGTFTDWDLAIEVAKIPDEVWKAGLSAVAEAIREIEAEFLVKRLPQVEEVFETEDGFYDVRGTISEPTKLVDSVSDRVRFAFDLAVQSNACDLNEMSTAAKVLRHALDNCRDDPNAMEQFFRNASAMIKDGLKRGIFGEDDALDFLTLTLDEVALQMRSDHPDVAAAVDARTKQALREIDEAKRLQAAEMIEDLREGTIARLNTELALAAETTRDGTSEDATAEALKQSGNRAGKISMAERAKTAEGSGVMAGLKMALRADKIVDFVTGLISGGGAL